jgi:hypothetical protein
VDIIHSEREKRVLKLGLYLLRKKLGKKSKKESIHKYLVNHENKVIQKLAKEIDTIGKQIKGKDQQKYFIEYLEFGLWLLYNHPDFNKILEVSINEFTKYNTKFKTDNLLLTKMDCAVLNLGFKYVFKRLSEKPTFLVIMKEAEVISNKLAKYLMSNCDIALKHAKSNEQHGMLKALLWFILWMGVHDTAYRDEMYYILNKIGNKELRDLTVDELVEPKDWYINLYEDAVKKSVRLRKEGKLNSNECSIEEEPCVKAFTKKKIERYKKIK